VPRARSAPAGVLAQLGRFPEGLRCDTGGVPGPSGMRRGRRTRIVPDAHHRSGCTDGTSAPWGCSIDGASAPSRCGIDGASGPSAFGLDGGLTLRGASAEWALKPQGANGARPRPVSRRAVGAARRGRRGRRGLRGRRGRRGPSVVRRRPGTESGVGRWRTKAGRPDALVVAAQTARTATQPTPAAELPGRPSTLPVDVPPLLATNQARPPDEATYRGRNDSGPPPGGEGARCGGAADQSRGSCGRPPSEGRPPSDGRPEPTGSSASAAARPRRSCCEASST
jgi:hypothetical protein